MALQLYRFRSRYALRDPGNPDHGNSTAGISFPQFVAAYLQEKPPPYADIGCQFDFVRDERSRVAVDRVFPYDGIEQFVDYMSGKIGTRSGSATRTCRRRRTAAFTPPHWSIARSRPQPVCSTCGGSRRSRPPCRRSPKTCSHRSMSICKRILRSTKRLRAAARVPLKGAEPARFQSGRRDDQGERPELRQAEIDIRRAGLNRTNAKASKPAPSSANGPGSGTGMIDSISTTMSE